MKSALILSLLLTACVNPVDVDQANRQYWKGRVGSLQYAQDPRTKLCFAGLELTRSVIFTHVPCTDEVLAHTQKP